jgi:hypothetical protein
MEQGPKDVGVGAFIDYFSVTFTSKIHTNIIMLALNFEVSRLITPLMQNLSWESDVLLT